MIYFVLKRAYSYCVASLTSEFGYPLPPNAALAYEDLFEASHAEPGTYIFSDIERLADNELEVAAELAALMTTEHGFQVLNNPARVRTRYAFLRAMREAGLNDFDAYRADGFPRPRTFPVFVRSEAAHIAPKSGLLADQAQLDAALAQMRGASQPLRGLIVVEFCAEPFRADPAAAEPAAETVWRRNGTFRIGDAVHFHDVVSEANWNVKYGQYGLVDEATYARDHEKVVSNYMADELRAAFDLAGIEYGRADFALVEARPQVYEINTNPCIHPMQPHASPVRSKSLALAREMLARDLVALCRRNDTSRGRPLPLTGPRLERLRKERRGETRRKSPCV